MPGLMSSMQRTTTFVNRLHGGDDVRDFSSAKKRLGGASGMRYGSSLGRTCKLVPKVKHAAGMSGSRKLALCSARYEKKNSDGAVEDGKTVLLGVRDVQRKQGLGCEEEVKSIVSSCNQDDLKSLQDKCNIFRTSEPRNIKLGATLLFALGGAGILGSGFDLKGPESVLEAIGVLAAVVGVHEAGHFLAARLQNIHVTKFAIGFGPPLLRFTRNEVEYSLRAFPLGGYVQFPDDDPDSPFPPDDPDLLRNRPVWDRILVTSAGVIANCVFALAICYVQASTVGISEPEFLPGVKLGSIYPDTVASRAGLKEGDILMSIDDMKVAPSKNAVESVVTKIGENPGKKLHLQLDRKGTAVEVDVVPAEIPDGSGRIGISLGSNMILHQRKASNPVEAGLLASREFKDLSLNVIRGLAQIIFNFRETASNVSGPVAILAVGSEVARTDSTGLLRFAALLNVNLAVVNVLPLPALDGEFSF